MRTKVGSDNHAIEDIVRLVLDNPGPCSFLRLCLGCVVEGHGSNDWVFAIPFFLSRLFSSRVPSLW